MNFVSSPVSGHGSQVPDLDGDEEDGLDEGLSPCSLHDVKQHNTQVFIQSSSVLTGSTLSMTSYTK